ncbi:Response regulator MprA [Anatilimnocola aggregata]|uniref:Response regulator MprA n=1 Tax=Anatilimnocola aggregata TaxID=2528021 RepID=A0A517YIF2_9BACT|nr:diguanylate cyclase [Anatilimnocola aggregata]QDU30010.1 Response regulator MprA [Anatilimnocola aggregata]
MSARPFSILIVSADRTLLRRMSKFLDIFGYEVRQASDEAQTLASAEANPPDFLLVDGSTESLANKQLCRQVRRLGAQQVFTYCMLLVELPEVAALTESLEAGFDDFLARDVVYGELLARLRAGARVLEYERRLAEQNGLDVITGLAERNAWLKQWKPWLQASAAEKARATPPYVAVLDFDSFGRFARVQGLIAYRELLRGAAQSIKKALPATALPGVLHDNRLAILFAAHDDAAAESLASGWLKSLQATSLQANGTSVQVTASLGFTAVQTDEPADIALQRAITALQLAKVSGRNCVVHSDEVDEDQQSWTELASEGQLFATTVARDVMIPCPVLIGADETVDQGLALFDQTQLATLPVVDLEGRLLGLITATKLANVRSQGSRPRQASVRLVRHVMQTEFAKFDETTSLNEMMEHFAESEQDVAVVVRDRCPTGLVFCQGLAALNERLNVTAFQPTSIAEGSEYLLVPEIYSSDTE